MNLLHILLVVTATIGFINATNSSVSSYNFTSAYSAEWYTFQDTSSTSYIMITLRYVGFSTSSSSWGEWLGVGYGSDQMDNTDITCC